LISHIVEGLRHDVEIEKPHALTGEFVNARSGCPTEDPATVDAQLPVTEVVGENENDVGFRAVRNGFSALRLGVSGQHDDGQRASQADSLPIKKVHSVLSRHMEIQVRGKEQWSKASAPTSAAARRFGCCGLFMFVLFL
jgi:hypothetical protein